MCESKPSFVIGKKIMDIRPKKKIIFGSFLTTHGENGCRVFSSKNMPVAKPFDENVTFLKVHF